MHNVLKVAKLWLSWSLFVPVFRLYVDFQTITKPSVEKGAACKLLLHLEVMHRAQLICGVYVLIKITTSTVAYDEFTALISDLECSFILLI